MYGSQRQTSKSQASILAERGLDFNCCHWSDATKLIDKAKFLELSRFNYGQSKPEKTVTTTTKTVWGY